MFPTAEQAAEALRLAEVVGSSQEWLMQRAQAKGYKLWAGAKYKRHMFQHLCEDFEYLNPKYAWTFKAISMTIAILLFLLIPTSKTLTMIITTTAKYNILPWYHL